MLTDCSSPRDSGMMAKSTACRRRFPSHTAHTRGDTGVRFLELPRGEFGVHAVDAASMARLAFSVDGTRGRCLSQPDFWALVGFVNLLFGRGCCGRSVPIQVA